MTWIQAPRLSVGVFIGSNSEAVATCSDRNLELRGEPLPQAELERLKFCLFETLLIHFLFHSNFRWEPQQLPFCSVSLPVLHRRNQALLQNQAGVIVWFLSKPCWLYSIVMLDIELKWIQCFSLFPWQRCCNACWEIFLLLNLVSVDAVLAGNLQHLVNISGKLSQGGNDDPQSGP